MDQSTESEMVIATSAFILSDHIIYGAIGIILLLITASIAAIIIGLLVCRRVRKGML